MEQFLIESALEEGLGRREGLQEVVESKARFQSSQRPRIIHSAAQYGLKWRHHVEEQAEANVHDIVNGDDGLTRL